MTTRILVGDVRERLRELPDESVHCVVTSPPYYGLRDYGTAKWEGGDPECDHIATTSLRRDSPGGFHNSTSRGTQLATKAVEMQYRTVCGKCGATRIDNQIGLESTLAEYIATMVDVFREVRRVLRSDGTCWINLGDSFYSGGSNANRSRPVQRESPYGTGGTEQQGYRPLDSAYPRLCDGCRDARSRHNSDSDQQHHESASLHGQIARDNGHRGSFAVTLDGAPLVVQASTSLESSQPPPGECWHCDNCGACLSVLGSSSRDVRLCARMAACTSGNERPASEHHTQDKDAWGLALAEPPYVQPQYTMNLKPKDLMMVPARLAIALQEDGWWLRSDIIWAKRAPMPESVTDRPTSAHEHVFLLAKQPRYFYDSAAVAEPSEEPDRVRLDRIGGVNGHTVRHSPGGMMQGVQTRNQRNVWTLGPEPFPDAHFATFPTEIPRRAIKAGTSERGVCAACGAPWVRQVERAKPPVVPDSEIDRFGTGKAGVHRKVGGQYQKWLDENPPQTTGWAPSCACFGRWQEVAEPNPSYQDGDEFTAPTITRRIYVPDADTPEPVPATVLDPFLGSGTTLLVADQLGRNGIGVELNPEYAAMAERRIRGDAPLFAAIEVLAS